MHEQLIADLRDYPSRRSAVLAFRSTFGGDAKLPDADALCASAADALEGEIERREASERARDAALDQNRFDEIDIFRLIKSAPHRSHGSIARHLAATLSAMRPSPWRPIAEADREIATIQTFDGVTLRNSHPAWVRDADGRTYEAVWTDHRGGYWWDIAQETPADPVEFYPHPLASNSTRADAVDANS